MLVWYPEISGEIRSYANRLKYQPPLRLFQAQQSRTLVTSNHACSTFNDSYAEVICPACSVFEKDHEHQWKIKMFAAFLFQRSFLKILS